jgi:hypothetical protein
MAMVSSRATYSLGRTRGTNGLGQYGCTKMMSTIEKEARRRQQRRSRFAPTWLPLLNYLPLCDVKLLFICDGTPNNEMM